MALFSVNIPEHLIRAIRRTGRSEEEVIVEALEGKFGEKLKSQKEMSPEEVKTRLLASGFILKPEELDCDAAQEWRNLSKEEKKLHLEEMESFFFPDSPASTFIIESRRVEA